MSRFAFILAIIATLFGATSAPAQSTEPVGVWLTEKGDARVKISKCGNGICGVIVGLKEPIDRATGQPQVDDKNPNPALRTRPVIGISLFLGMHLRRRDLDPSRALKNYAAIALSAVAAVA
jgi:hypothetical protein